MRSEKIRKKRKKKYPSMQIFYCFGMLYFLWVIFTCYFEATHSGLKNSGFLDIVEYDHKPNGVYCLISYVLGGGQVSLPWSLIFFNNTYFGRWGGLYIRLWRQYLVAPSVFKMSLWVLDVQVTNIFKIPPPPLFPPARFPREKKLPVA